MNVAIIPARGGSKRIPRKNIKKFMGKPMIAYSIEAALSTQCIDRVIVTTDDEEIAKVAESFGAAVPFIRPASLADDYTATVPVIKHAIESLEASCNMVEYACCIYATAPFVSSTDIEKGFEAVRNGTFDYVLSITSYPYPIQRSLRVNDYGAIEMIHPELWETRSQDLEERYHDAGQFYWGNKKSWLEDKPLLSSSSKGIIVPRYRVQDIDTLEDWNRAELMFQALVR